MKGQQNRSFPKRFGHHDFIPNPTELRTTVVSLKRDH